MKKTLKLDFLALEKYFSWQELSNSKNLTRPKFSRRIVKPVRLYLYGIIAKFYSQPISSKIQCDVLMLHRSENSRKRGLRDHVTKQLRKQGLNVIEAQTENNQTILKNNLFSTPPVKTPLKFLFYASYANYIVENYSPKVILTETNGSDLSPFLKAFLPEGSSLVHVAHCAITDNYRHYSLIDYDYYFLYGKSSFDKLHKRDNLFGSCKAVLTGPYIPHHAAPLPPCDANKNILLFGVNPNMERRPHIQKIYAFIKNLAQKHTDYQLFVKIHPRSETDFWDRAQASCPNIHFIKQGTDMQEALSDISITLGIYTNAVLDAALRNRPSLLVSDDTVDDEFDIEKFFLPRCRNESELQANIEKLLANYPYYVEKTIEFSQYHLAHQDDSVNFIAQCVADIAHNKESFPIEPLHGTIFSN